MPTFLVREGLILMNPFNIAKKSSWKLLLIAGAFWGASLVVGAF